MMLRAGRVLIPDVAVLPDDRLTEVREKLEEYRSRGS